MSEPKDSQGKFNPEPAIISLSDAPITDDQKATALLFCRAIAGVIDLHSKGKADRFLLIAIDSVSGKLEFQSNIQDPHDIISVLVGIAERIAERMSPDSSEYKMQ
jgi:hypothetical protein